MSKFSQFYYTIVQWKPQIISLLYITASPPLSSQINVQYSRHGSNIFSPSYPPEIPSHNGDRSFTIQTSPLAFKRRFGA